MRTLAQRAQQEAQVGLSVSFSVAVRGASQPGGHSLGSIVHPVVLEEPIDMRPDRRRGEVQAPRNQLVRMTFGHQCDDFRLPLSETHLSTS
jgi:hypothetical protein